MKILRTRSQKTIGKHPKKDKNLLSNSLLPAEMFETSLKDLTPTFSIPIPTREKNSKNNNEKSRPHSYTNKTVDILKLQEFRTTSRSSTVPNLDQLRNIPQPASVPNEDIKQID